MADIRCPMCGNPASEELDTCPFCQARLKPLNITNASSGITDPAAQEPAESEVTPSPSEESVPLSSSAEEELRGWLSGLDQVPLGDFEDPGSLPDPVENPGKEPSPDEPDRPTSSMEDANWLDQLRGDSVDQGFAQADSQEIQEEEAFSNEGIPDWMRKIDSEVASQVVESPPVKEDQPEPEKEAAPDWLVRLQAETQAFAQTDENAIPEKEEAAPGWLDEITTSDSLPAEQGLQAVSDVPGLEEIPQFETRILAEENEPAIPADLDWSKELQPGSQVEIAGGQVPQSDDPDWLKALEPEVAILAADDQLSKAEMPDWLKDMGNEIPPPAVLDDLTGVPGMAGDGETDWLKSLGMENNINQAAASKTSLSSEIPEQPPGSELIAAGSLPFEEPKSIPGNASALISDELFSIEDEIATMLPAEVPDWLSELKTEADEIQVEDLSGTDQVSEPIFPAELPGWVKAMQPIEFLVSEMAVPDSHPEKMVEEAGPLAGLRGVLPSTPGMGALRKPLSYPIKLRITDEQNRQATQLEQMVITETQPRTAALPGRGFPKRAFRWMVSILLVLAMGFPMVSGLKIIPPPSLLPQEIKATHEKLVGLPSNSPVLLVFDYEPAFSGELEATASPLLEDLMSSSARLAILSTSPTGSILAEHFLKISRDQTGYPTSQQVANLGYLAGGATGVLSFAGNPSGSMPYALDGSQPWQTPLLQDVQTLADFGAVIILTDNSDTARIWIEQAGTLLEQSPMLMAISAQIEPMIRPYFESQQVKGLVTGLAGGMAYEQALQRPGLGQLYWDSFGSGIFLANLIIIIGSIWSIISNRRNRRHNQKEEA
jgi:hypothetical protein